MKNSLLLFGIFAIYFATANGFTGYKNNIATDRLLVIFQPGTTAGQKAEIIKAAGTVTSFTHLPAPALTICHTSDFNAAQNYFSANPAVAFVSFFVTDGKGHYAGVLNDFFVKLKDKNFEPLLNEKLKQLQLGQAIPDKYTPNLYKIENTGKAQNTIDVCALFLNLGWVDYAAPNYLLNPLVASDPLYNRQWNINNTGSVLQGRGLVDADMDVDSAWTLTTGDPNIKVGVIDSGVDTLHEDLAQNILPGHDAISDSTDGYPTPAYPEDGHGTCCSGIIAAVKDNAKGCIGVAPSCKIIPVRAFYYVVVSNGGDPLPYSTSAAFSDAIGWAWSVGNADILSNSWGLPSSFIAFLAGGVEPVNDAIHTAYLNGRGGKGLAMFFSSGNENGSGGPIWPGSQPETISVNATNMCDSAKTPGDCSGEAWGGDHGVGLDFSAPGVKITTTDMTGANGFSNSAYTYTFNGTSAACPNAAAVGALILSLRPELGAEDIRNLISQTCDKVTYSYDSTYFNGSWCPQTGFGRVNAFRALQQSFFYSGITESAPETLFNVFPNPTQGQLNIQYHGPQNARAKLYTITGAQVAEVELAEGPNKVDVSLLPAGLYLLKADTRGLAVTKKITIVRQ
jgi:subtilisin family serine protease